MCPNTIFSVQWKTKPLPFLKHNLTSICSLRNLEFPEAVGSPLRLEPEFSRETVELIEVLVVRERLSRVSIDQNGKFWDKDFFFWKIIDRVRHENSNIMVLFLQWVPIPMLQDNRFQTINNSKHTQGKHWLMVARKHSIQNKFGCIQMFNHVCQLLIQKLWTTMRLSNFQNLVEFFKFILLGIFLTRLFERFIFWKWLCVW